MKIKCPFCHKIEEYRSYQMLGNHLQSHKDRGVYPFVITFCLAELIFKIHEKITENETYLEKYMKEEVEPMGESEVFVSEQYESVIAELKSLLK